MFSIATPVNHMRENNPFVCYVFNETGIIYFMFLTMFSFVTQYFFYAYLSFAIIHNNSSEIQLQ